MYKTKITIHGIVQKVGLRAQIKIIADRLGLCGTVENLGDGSVLVVCEAQRADVEEMVRQIRSGAKPAVIADVLVEEGLPATGMEGFEVILGDSTEEMLSAMSTGTRAMVGMLTVLDEIKHGQSRLEKGQDQTNETLARMEKGQNDLKRGQDQTNETLARMEKGQNDLKRGQDQTKDVIESMDSKLDVSLENDARSLEILRDLRDGGLLRVP
ncbi:MAG: acylphosphatase [Nitrosopumilaceae archaeon]|nr:acylphosphatase [Nitrosopumilaceae archaeon]